MKKAILILLVFSHSLFAQMEGEWQIIGQMPHPVAGAEMVYDSGNIYVLGGYSDSTQAPVNWIQKYSTFLDVWKMLDTMKYARYGFVMDRDNNEVYYCGGIIETSGATGILEAWEISGENRIVADNPYFNRIFASGHILNSKLYIIGGNQFLFDFASSVPFIIEYDLKVDSVSRQMEGNIPLGLELPEQQITALYGSDIFIFGGVYNGISNAIYKYNTLEHSLQKLDIDLLEPRAGGKAVVSEFFNEIYILGGYNENGEALKTVEIFTINDPNYTIREGPSMNFARRNFMALSSQGSFYLMGGYDENDKIVPEIEFLGEQMTDARDQIASISNKFMLYQNYPNPFNPETTIKYEISNNKGGGKLEPLFVSLVVYDILGCEIKTLVNEYKSPGIYQVELNAGDLPSGVYLYKLIAGDFVSVKKMTVLR